MANLDSFILGRPGWLPDELTSEYFMPRRPGDGAKAGRSVNLVGVSRSF